MTTPLRAGPNSVMRDWTTSQRGNSGFGFLFLQVDDFGPAMCNSAGISQLKKFLFYNQIFTEERRLPGRPGIKSRSTDTKGGRRLPGSARFRVPSIPRSGRSARK